MKTCEVCGEDTSFPEDQMCPKHLMLEEDIENDIKFTFEVLSKCSPEFKRLKAVDSRIKEYVQHTVQAKRIKGTGVGDLIAEDEELFAKEALHAAIKLSRGIQ